METFSALLAICAGHSPGTGEFPAQRPVTRSFDVFFGLRLNKQLSKQSWGWWFETPSRLLRRHRNDSFHQPGKLIVKYTDPFKHGYTLMLWNSFCRKHNELQILQWRHNGHDGVPNHQPHHCLLNRLFERISKKTSKLWWPMKSPHKWPITRKMFPFDDIIMTSIIVARQ